MSLNDAIGLGIVLVAVFGIISAILIVGVQ